MDKIKITIFTDPMMGLSYEMEPVFDELRKYYGASLEIDYVMSGLVRDISDFMTKEELSLPEEEGIIAYNKRLAMIYKSEESIGGRPINMKGFHLFDKEHRSSYPLNIAYEAVKIVNKTKAEQFLKALAHATIVETKQTTKVEEILEVVQKVGIDIETFKECFDSEKAEKAFQKDLEYRTSLGIYSLPAYLIQKNDQSIIIKSLIGVEEFKRVTSTL